MLADDKSGRATEPDPPAAARQVAADRWLAGFAFGLAVAGLVVLVAHLFFAGSDAVPFAAVGVAVFSGVILAFWHARVWSLFPTRPVLQTALVTSAVYVAAATLLVISLAVGVEAVRGKTPSHALTLASLAVFVVVPLLLAYAMARLHAALLRRHGLLLGVAEIMVDGVLGIGSDIEPSERGRYRRERVATFACALLTAPIWIFSTKLTLRGLGFDPHALRIYTYMALGAVIWVEPLLRPQVDRSAIWRIRLALIGFAVAYAPLMSAGAAGLVVLARAADLAADALLFGGAQGALAVTLALTASRLWSALTTRLGVPLRSELDSGSRAANGPERT